MRERAGKAMKSLSRASKPGVRGLASSFSSSPHARVVCGGALDEGTDRDISKDGGPPLSPHGVSCRAISFLLLAPCNRASLTPVGL